MRIKKTICCVIPAFVLSLSLVLHVGMLCFASTCLRSADENRYRQRHETVVLLSDTNDIEDIVPSFIENTVGMILDFFVTVDNLCKQYLHFDGLIPWEDIRAMLD